MKSAYKITFKRRIIWIAILFVLIFLVFRLKNYPVLVEEYFSLEVYPLIRTSLQFLFNVVPFSVGDVLYLLIFIAFCISSIQIIRLTFKRKFKIGGLVFLSLILNLEITILVFYLFWGLNYFRQPASKRLDLVDTDYKASDLFSVSSMLIDSVNSIRASLRPSDLQQSESHIHKASISAVQKLSATSPSFRSSAPMVKSSLLSPILNYMGTAGYYNPFTGEAQINSQMPVFLRPFVACHEMAHQTGFGAEDEANFVGFLSGITSNDRLLKYSTYYVATQEFLIEVWKTDSVAFKMMKKKISMSVLEDFKTEKEYWIKYHGGAGIISGIFYDNYLKANKQPEGLKTYNRMIKLTMAYYRRKRLIKHSSFAAE